MKYIKGRKVVEEEAFIKHNMPELKGYNVQLVPARGKPKTDPFKPKITAETCKCFVCGSSTPAVWPDPITTTTEEPSAVQPKSNSKNSKSAPSASDLGPGVVFTAPRSGICTKPLDVCNENAGNGKLGCYGKKLSGKGSYCQCGGISNWGTIPAVYVDDGKELEKVMKTRQADQQIEHKIMRDLQRMEEDNLDGAMEREVENVQSTSDVGREDARIRKDLSGSSKSSQKDDKMAAAIMG